ncbi:MAG: cell division protein FtsX [Barnesiella sp.]
MTAKRHFTFFNARMTSTLSVSLVLFILGIMVLMGLLASNLSTHVKENIGFSIILKESAKDSQIQQLQKILNKAPYVKASQFISKEDALKEVMIELGENPEDVLGANPLQSSIEVRLKAEYARNDSISWIEKGLRSNQAVSDITYQKDLIQSVNDNIKKIGLILSVLALVLMVISFALISNTIRLSAYSKRFIIHTMKLVGATPGFIRKPFIVSNIANGVIAAFIAILLLSGCIYYLTNEIDNFYTLINVELLATVYIIVLLLGIVLTAVSAYFSVNRYIHMDRDDLYYV